jgi:hypothetical protein
MLGSRLLHAVVHNAAATLNAMLNAEARVQRSSAE